MKTDEIIRQLDFLTLKFENLKEQVYRYSNDPEADFTDLDDDLKTEFITQSMAAVRRIAGPTSDYYGSILQIANSGKGYSYKLAPVFGCIKALKSDVEHGYLVSMTERIHGDMFSDYLEMADHLIGENLKDPAAVIIGSTLESHVRRLCEKYEIDLVESNAKGILKPKSFDKLNGELCKKEIYNLNNNKQLTAWYGIRTSAAHGKYEDVDLEYVKLMLAGTRMFIEQYPA